MSNKDVNLVVTLGGRPVPDQALGIRAFKDACLAASKTPPPQAGEWTLTAPDGRTWKAESPLKCCGLEQRERVPANVALARIVEEMERFDAEEVAKVARCKHGVAIDPTGNYVCVKCFREPDSSQETPADDVCPTTGQPHRMPKGQVCLYCHIGNLGQFVRGDICPTSCKNCGRHYNDHLHTDEASLCPTANRGESR
jgi:hypothetical protein